MRPPAAVSATRNARGVGFVSAAGQRASVQAGSFAVPTVVSVRADALGTPAPCEVQGHCPRRCRPGPHPPGSCSCLHSHSHSCSTCPHQRSRAGGRIAATGVPIVVGADCLAQPGVCLLVASSWPLRWRCAAAVEGFRLARGSESVCGSGLIFVSGVAASVVTFGQTTKWQAPTGLTRLCSINLALRSCNSLQKQQALSAALCMLTSVMLALPP